MFSGPDSAVAPGAYFVREVPFGRIGLLARHACRSYLWPRINFYRQHMYRLLQFNVRSRSEPARLMLEFGGCSYECKSPGEGGLPAWPTMKQEGLRSGSVPFGQLPVLEHNGNVIAQSNAIYRYLARELRLYGASNVEAGVIDMLLEHMEDIYQKYLPLIYVMMNEASAREDYLSSIRPKFEQLEAVLARLSTSPEGWMVGASPSVADFVAFELLDIHVRIAPATYFDAFRRLKAVHTRVSELPQIEAYVRSGRRPAKINGNGLGESPDEGGE